MDPKDAIFFFGFSSMGLEYLACPPKTQMKRNPPIAVGRDANAQKKPPWGGWQRAASTGARLSYDVFALTAGGKMFDAITTWFLNPPKRLIAFGRGLSSCGLMLLVFGLAGQTALRAGAVAQSMAKLQTSTQLSEIYPSLPTWFVPEGVFGFGFALVLAAFGLWLQAVGKKYSRAFW